MKSIEHNPINNFFTDFKTQFEELKEITISWTDKKNEELESFKIKTLNSLRTELVQLVEENKSKIESENSENFEVFSKTVKEEIEGKLIYQIDQFREDYNYELSKFTAEMKNLLSEIKEKTQKEFDVFLKTYSSELELLKSKMIEINTFQDKFNILQDKISKIFNEYYSLQQSITNYLDNGIYSKELSERLTKIEQDLFHKGELVDKLTFDLYKDILSKFVKNQEDISIIKIQLESVKNAV